MHFCIDCSHCSLWAEGFNPRLPSSHACDIVALSPVTGFDTDGIIKCEVNRAAGGICGPDALLFEAKGP